MWWKCIKTIGLCHIYTTLKYSNCLKLWDISLAGKISLSWPLTANYTKTTEKAESHFPGYIFFTFHSSLLEPIYADMQGPSVLSCWTALQHFPVCSDLVRNCCLKERWDRMMAQQLLRNMAASWASELSLLSSLAQRNWYAVTFKIAEIWLS